MKILTNKHYAYLKTFEKENERFLQTNKLWLEENLKLKEELKEAKDFKKVLDKLTENSLYSINGLAACGFTNGSFILQTPDNVLVYVDDILGGKVIKQEANKCLVIDKNGNVKTGLTKEKVDKNYTYKLVRE